MNYKKFLPIAITVAIIALTGALVLACMAYFGDLSKSDYEKKQKEVQKTLLDSIYTNTAELKEFHEKTGWNSITGMEKGINLDLKQRPSYTELFGDDFNKNQIPKYVDWIKNYFTAEGVVDTNYIPDTSYTQMPLLYFAFYGKPHTVLDRIDTIYNTDNANYSYSIECFYKLTKPDDAVITKITQPTEGTKVNEKKVIPTTHIPKRRRSF